MTDPLTLVFSVLMITLSLFSASSLFLKFLSENRRKVYSVFLSKHKTLIIVILSFVVVSIVIFFALYLEYTPLFLFVSLPLLLLLFSALIFGKRKKPYVSMGIVVISILAMATAAASIIYGAFSDVDLPPSPSVSTPPATPTPSPTPLSPLDIINPFFYLDVSDEDIADICDRAVLFLNQTPYLNSTELRQEYLQYVTQADEFYRLAQSAYNVTRYQGERNLVSDASKAEIRYLHEDWLNEVLLAYESRKSADHVTMTFANARELGNYCVSMGDVYIRLENAEAAYLMYFNAIQHYTTALQLSLSSNNGREKAISTLRDLSDIYGIGRLQNYDIRLLSIRDFGSLELLQDTAAFYRALQQRVDELTFSELD